MKFLYYTLAFVPVLILLLVYAFRLVMRLTKPLMNFENKKLWKTIRILLSVSVCIISFMVFSVPGIIALHFLVLSLVTDIIMWLVNKFFRLKGKSEQDELEQNELSLNSIFRYIFSAVATIIIILYGYFNLNHLVPVTYTLDSSKIEGEGYRVVFLSDTHYGGIQQKQVLREK